MHDMKWRRFVSSLGKENEINAKKKRLYIGGHDTSL